MALKLCIVAVLSYWCEICTAMCAWLNVFSGQLILSQRTTGHHHSHDHGRCRCTTEDKMRLDTDKIRYYTCSGIVLKMWWFVCMC